MSSVSFVRENHCVGLNEYHMEWCPKYRFECMKNPHINKEVERIILHVAQTHNIVVKSIAVGFDYVHLHVALPFVLSPSLALLYLKGGSAYLIFRRFPNFRKRYPKGSFWSPGKFVRSISDVTAVVVDDYIMEQQFEKLVGVKDESSSSQLGLSSFF